MPCLCHLEGYAAGSKRSGSEFAFKLRSGPRPRRPTRSWRGGSASKLLRSPVLMRSSVSIPVCVRHRFARWNASETTIGPWPASGTVLAQGVGLLAPAVALQANRVVSVAMIYTAAQPGRAVIPNDTKAALG